jgi:hypothetical protein
VGRNMSLYALNVCVSSPELQKRALLHLEMWN